MTSTEGNESQEPSGGLLAAGHPLPSLRPHKNRNCSSRSAVTDEHPRPASYYESFAYPYAAIDREKEIKGWRRSKKIRLIESMNPHWYDLAEHWTEVYKPDNAEQDPRQIPHPAEGRRASG